jgi:N-methylhydantoinase A
VLGYLDPAFFLGGGMALDLAGARAAIDRYVAQPLGMTIEQAAWGIHQIVNESMASAARVHTLERGKDPRGLPVFAFGGAGPVHGHRVALALGAPALIAPFGAGVMSAIGFLSAPLAFDFVRSAPGGLDGLDWERINALLDEMQAEGQALLVASGVPAEQITHRRAAEMRYAGQGHEISVPLMDGRLDASHVPELRAAFETEYRRLYGRLGPPVPLEAITWRVIASGPRPELRLRFAGQTNNDLASARKGTRLAYVPELGGMVETPVYDRYRLGPGAAFDGPAIVEERESTLIVGSGGRCRVDAQWNLIVEHLMEGDDGRY